MMTKLITKESEILKFNISYYLKKPTIKDVEKVNIDVNEAFRLKNWALIKNEYYYVKNAQMLNEIIGETIAKQLDLKTAHYEPINYFGVLSYISKNFRERDKEYNRVEDYFKTYTNIDLLDRFKTITTKENFELLKLQINKMWALDIFMRQLDRSMTNLLIEKKNGNLELAPLFDYSAAFMTSTAGFKHYENPIYSMDIKNIDPVLEKYPELINIFGTLIDKDILKYLKEELEKYKLNFHSEIKNYYQKEFDDSKRNLERMIGR